LIKNGGVVKVTGGGFRLKTVLIVDDELPARELLKMSLDWESLGFSLPLEASNGKIALEQYIEHRPDFIITDIQMPVMDGIELIEKIKAINPHQHIIILSCHESFSYAKKALKLGVMDYLIKDALNADTLADILLVENLPAQIFEPAKGNTPELLKYLLNGELGSEVVTDILKPLIKDQHQFFCCAVTTGRIAPDYTDISSISDKLRIFLASNFGGDVCWVGENTFYILVIMTKGISSMENLNIRSSMLHSMRAIFKQYPFESITFGVSNFSNEAELISEKISEAQQALKSLVFLGKGKTIFYDKTHTCMPLSGVKTLEFRISRIKDAISQGNGDDVREEIKQLYQKDLNGMMQYNYLHHINTLLLTMLTERCLSEDISFKEVFGTEMLSELPTNGSCDTVEEMQNWYLDKFSNYFARVQTQRDYEQSPRVQKIRQFIEENYNKDISLETVAERFGLHKVYLAKIFKDAMDYSVNEYIRTVKAEKAKELLENKNIRISAIVEMLGYNNPQSFYNMFKSSVGMSPKEYREQLLEEGH